MPEISTVYIAGTYKLEKSAVKSYRVLIGPGVLPGVAG